MHRPLFRSRLLSGVALLMTTAALLTVSAAPTAAKPKPECAPGGVKVPAAASPATVTVSDTTTGSGVPVLVTITGTTFTIAPGTTGSTLEDASWCLKASTKTQNGTGTTGASTLTNKTGVPQAIGYLVVYTVTSDNVSPNTIEVPVVAGSDDAEQAIGGSTDLTSPDLELTTDGTTQQIVGTRFTGLQIPQGATISNAYIQFRTAEVSTGAAQLTIRAEAHDNTPTYSAVDGNLAVRATTTANVSWTPPAWNTIGQSGTAQRTPNIASLVKAIVDRPGWSQGNALAVQFSGTGVRTADAFESGAALASPVLHVEWDL